MLRFLARLLISLYLRSALLFGYHRHVYRLTSKWGGSGGWMPVRYRVAADMQPRLFALGYHRCPSCEWATEMPNEHITVQGSWCWEQTLPKCSCCGLPESDCQMASEADLADYYEEQRRQDEQKEAEMAAAWEWFEAEELRKQQEADEEALREDCGQERYEPCGCPLYECTCDEYEDTPEDALTDFVDSWSPVHGVTLPEGHEDHDGHP